MYNGYTDHQMAPFDAEFRRQLDLLRNAGQTSPQMLSMLYNMWESNKRNEYAQAFQYTNSPITGDMVYRFVGNFINKALQQITSASMSSFGNNMQMPYQNNGMWGCGYQQHPPLGANMGFSNMGGVAGCQSQPLTNNVVPIDYVKIPESKPVTSTTNNDKKSEQDKPGLSIIKSTFIEPSNDDDDTVYGTKERETSIGSIKVNPMRDGSGAPFKQVVIRLNEPCRNKLEAYNRARLIYRDKRCSHIDIQYDLAVTLPIPYEKGRKVITSIKKAIPKSSAASNPLKYLQTIQKILDEESRGVGDALEGFLLSRYNYVGTQGCLSSDQDEDDSSKMALKSLTDLINLSNKDYNDPGINLWQAKPGFMTNLVKCVNNTIRKDMMECDVLDPSDPIQFAKIIRLFTGLTEDDEGNLVDVTAEILPKSAEFVAASAKERSTNFGSAGAIIASSTTIVLKNQHLVYTDLVPSEFVFETLDHHPYIVKKQLYIGGYTDDEPNKPDTCFEFMMMKASLASLFWTDLLINVADKYGTAFLMFKCIPTTDKWVSITGTEM